MSNLDILMVAAENDFLPGAKVGGVGDVIRDLPASLIQQGCSVKTAIPSYGFLQRLSPLHHCGLIEVEFAGEVLGVELYRFDSAGQASAYILHHERFSPQGESVYCHDGDDRPFATDASKFALFSSALAEALLQGLIPKPDVLHCHDWHAAFLLILLRYSNRYSGLSSIKTVFSIHNLAMQGVRPMRKDPSSFETWFPGLVVDPREITDLNAPHCVNPLRAGIRIADKVHTVSPSYAEEILKASDPENGIYGGEGLELDLCDRAEASQLVGILNGCEYPKAASKKKISKTAFIKLCHNNIESWGAVQAQLSSAHWIAEKRLSIWAKKKGPELLLTSVGRVTDQKVSLLLAKLENGETALDAILTHLGTQSTFVMLGSGDKTYEQELVKVSARHENFVFLKGFSNVIADALYHIGQVFFMPSSFEPCGISQLLAMREGQPCLVNRVGGLKDTVEPGVTGFAFEGDTQLHQAHAMVDAVVDLIEQYKTKPEAILAIGKAAKEVRFTWEVASQAYISELYR